MSVLFKGLLRFSHKNEKFKNAEIMVYFILVSSINDYNYRP